MTKKYILLLVVIISCGFIYGCDVLPENIIPETINLEDSIKEIILSKGQDYDFLSDDLFLSKINELGLSNHFTVGNLDDDNIPEIALFVERNPDDTEDKGKLQVYKFSGEKYELLDSVDMNYDNTNYILKIGKISQTHNGVLLSNQVGAHSGVTYGYRLEDGKLKSILNEKRISLISISTNNEIKDIDNDGILEFSIYSIDPETENQNPEDSDKIILWYKWDGTDGGELIQIDRIPGDASSNIKSLNADNKKYDISEADFIPYIKEYISEYNKYELTDLIMKHIETLDSNIDNRSSEVNNLIINNQNKNNTFNLESSSDLYSDRLNDVEYLKREKILQSDPELKDHLIKHIDMGYKVETSEGNYFYVVDYQKFIDNFGEFVTKEFRDYLNIKAKDTNEKYLSDGALLISREKLSERIVEIEKFRITYPYSSFIEEVSELYSDYVKILIYGNINTPNLNNENKFSDGSLAVFQDIINKYPDTQLADILLKLLDAVSQNLNVLTDDNREIINNLIK